MAKGLFDWAVNDGRIGQGFSTWCGLLNMPAKAIVEMNSWDISPTGLTRIESPLKFITENGNPEFALMRTFSLGDMLMVVPVARLLKHRGYNVALRVPNNYVPLLRAICGEAVEVYASEGSWNGYCVNLDQLVERDHADPVLQKMHRCDIYAKALGLKDYVAKDFDWSIEPDRFVIDPLVPLPEHYIVFQGRGNTPYRGLTSSAIETTIAELVASGVKVVYIGTEAALDLPDGVIKLYQKQTLLQLFSCIMLADAVVSMDSSPLWISHFTSISLVAVLGPSRASERVIYHPLYPEGVEVIDLAALHKCQPCFEQAEKCEYLFDCMLETDEKTVSSLITQAVLKFWNGR
jgi:ADP-heptose:LPS heptosyltransferase